VTVYGDCPPCGHSVGQCGQSLSEHRLCVNARSAVRLSSSWRIVSRADGPDNSLRELNPRVLPPRESLCANSVSTAFIFVCLTHCSAALRAIVYDILTLNSFHVKTLRLLSKHVICE